MECAYDNLVGDGQLVLSTPNTFSFAKLARVIGRVTNEPPVNPEHTFYFTPRTLAHLASRHGFILQDVKYCELDYAPDHGGRMKRAQLRVNAQMSRRLPRFSQTMVLIFDKDPHHLRTA